MNQKLADIMFPDVATTPEYYENLYPLRQCKQGARITRIAPSPTGYLHLGVLFTAMVNQMTARASDGVFYFRLEDTDKKREVEGGAEDILNGLRAYGVIPDEGFIAPGVISGDYGPYRQSERTEIYQTYAKALVGAGLAYPCFCSEQELQSIRQEQERQKLRTGYLGEFAVCRNLEPEQAIKRIKSEHPYVVRLRSGCAPGNQRIVFNDLIKGKIEMPENDEAFVLLKSDGIPTYHFAHAIDDHLMRTTHVIRGDEWISSVPKHIQLFSMLGFKPPKYAHVSPIMKEEGSGKRKLSKRKDPEAAVRYYAEQGFPADSVLEYLMTVACSDYEQWRRCNPKKTRDEFPFGLKKMSASGALFDLLKLNDVSKTVIAGMDADAVLSAVLEWAKKYAPDYFVLLDRDHGYAREIFSVDRGGAKPRKDIAKWCELPEYTAYFFDETFRIDDAMPDSIKHEDIRAILTEYAKIYDPQDDRQQWFDKIKSICTPLGFCPDVKQYKSNPDQYKGHVGDVSTVIRIAVTGRKNTPDLCSIMRVIGRERVLARFEQAVTI